MKNLLPGFMMRYKFIATLLIILWSAYGQAQVFFCPDDGLNHPPAGIPHEVDSWPDGVGGTYKLVCTNESNTGDFVYSHCPAGGGAAKVIGRCVYVGGRNCHWNVGGYYIHICRKPDGSQASVDIYCAPFCIRMNCVMNYNTATGCWVEDLALRHYYTAPMFMNMSPIDADGNSAPDEGLATITAEYYSGTPPPLPADYVTRIALTSSVSGLNRLIKWNTGLLNPVIKPGNYITLMGINTTNVNFFDPRFTMNTIPGGIKLTCNTQFAPNTGLNLMSVHSNFSSPVNLVTYNVVDPTAESFYATIFNQHPLLPLNAMNWSCTPTMTDMPGYISSAGTLSLYTPSVIDAYVHQVTCNGANNGMIMLHATGSSPTFNFNWSNGQTGASIRNLAPGTYSVVVTDNAGLNTTTSYTITEPAPINVTAVTLSNISCAGGNDGSLDAIAIGGTPPLRYSWALDTGGSSWICPLLYAPVCCNGVQYPNQCYATCAGATGCVPFPCISSPIGFVSGLPAANYIVSVSDAKGCVRTATASVIATNLPFTISAPGPVSIACGESILPTGRPEVVSNGALGYWIVTDNWVKCYDINGNQIGLTQNTAGRATIVINPAGGFWMITDTKVKCFDNNGNQIGLTQNTAGRATIVVNPLGGFWMIDDNKVKCFDNNGNQIGLTQNTAGRATIVINPLGGFWMIDDNKVKCFDNNGNQIGLTQNTAGRASIVINPAGGFWMIDDNKVKCFDNNGNQIGLTQNTAGRATIVVNPLGGFWMIDDTKVKCFDNNGNQIGLTQNTAGRATIVINPLGGFWMIDDNKVKCFDNNGNQIGLTQNTAGRATIVINPLGGFWLIDDNSVKCFDNNGNQIGLTQNTTGRATVVINPLGGFWLIDDNSVKCFDNNGNQIGLTQNTAGRATIVINPNGGFWMIDDNKVKCFDNNGNQIGLTQNTAGRATIVINPNGGFWMIDDTKVKCFDNNGNQVGLTQNTAGRATIVINPLGGFWMIDDTHVKCFDNLGNQVGLTQNTNGRASITQNNNIGYAVHDATSVSFFNPNGTQQGLAITMTGGPAIEPLNSNPTLTYNDLLINGTCPGNYSIQRTWTGTNLCSTISNATQVIHVQDNIPPSLTPVANTSVQCMNAANNLLYFWKASAVVPPGLHPYDLHVVFAGTGGSVDNEKLTKDPGVPPGTISHSNGNGNTNFVDIVWTNPLNPGDVVEFEFSTEHTPVVVAASWWTDSSHNFLDTANATVAFHGNFPSTGHPEVSDLCSASPLLSVSDVVSGTPGNYLITRTWTALDECNNSSSTTQTITVHDLTPPVISNCPSSIISSSCGTGQVFWQPPTITDNCGTPTLTSNYQPGAIFPVGNTTVTYIAQDSAGNSSACYFVVTVNASHVLNVAVDQQISCAGNNDGSVQATASGGNGIFVYNIDGGPFNNLNGFFTNLNVGVHTVCASSQNCITCGTVTMTQPAPLIAAIQLNSVPSCGSQRSLSAVISGGVPPYSVYWYNASNVLIGNQMTISNLPPATYSLVAEDNHGCYDTATITIPFVPCQSTLFLTCYIQGYWNSQQNNMAPVLANQGRPTTLNACDTIDVALHQAAAPFAQLYTTRTVLNRNGTAVCNFPATTGNFYIVVKHRNALQTWSSIPVAIGNSPVSYNFTTAANKAYGSNQVQVAPGKFAFFSGDVIQDENMDLLDVGAVEMGINDFLFGYHAIDINGDGNIDLLDIPVLETNVNDFIFSIHP